MNDKRHPSKVHADEQGKSIILDSASTFYAQLLASTDEALPLSHRYDMLRNVFAHAVAQGTMECQIAFVGFFSKVDYCIKEYDIPFRIAAMIHLARKEMFPEWNRKREAQEEVLQRDFAHNLKATAYLVHHLFGREEIPASLSRHFPKADRKQSWGRYDENVLRIVVDHWDENYIWGTEEENGLTLQVCYGPENSILTRDGKGDWSYLQQVLWKGAQLNLVRIRHQEEAEEICFPELIILEPDYLINITSISTCFESYAESPFVHLVNKLKPQANSMAIHLGNLAGQLLDDTIHDRHIPFDESIRRYVSQHALSMISCPDMTTREKFLQFKEDAQLQQQNIQRLIGLDLPLSIGNYDRRKVFLEPSFYSEILGIQGRLDFLYQADDEVTIIEQKSGKGEFVPSSSPGFRADTPLAKEQHTVQVLLYRALFQYEFQMYAEQLKHIMLLYSKYTRGLLLMPQSPELFLRAIRMRNLLAWSEIHYAHEGMEELRSLTPERLNMKHASGKLWENYTRPQLEELLQPIQQASELERLYYLRFLRFLENEQLLSKVGNRMKENSGFAAIWHDTLEDKRSAGNIYDQLSIESFGYEEEAINEVTLRFAQRQSADTTNFRTGDIVILYPYPKEGIPNACAQMVIRASIVDIQADTLCLRLRNQQTDACIFDRQEESYWAVEHDMMESASGGLYSAMHAFLSATRRRRDLLLLQREPEVDTSRTPRGEYGPFDTLVTRACQARDLFLIIGPPGTGKTSFGLVNLLEEELLQPGTNILLLSYTNRAVDEICSKLVEIRQRRPDFDFLRIGSDLSCAEPYRDYLLSNRSAQVEGGNGVYRLIQETRVFCGTTAAINANLSLLQLKQFSLAIVDESSQILEPHLIGLFSAHRQGVESIGRFVLIGDHKQLPAVVQQTPDESAVSEPELQAIHLTDCRLSLFERLLRQFRTAEGYDPRFVYMLTRQGRMHQEIAAFPNVAFYGNRLDVVPLSHQMLPTEPTHTGQAIADMLSAHRVSFVAAPSPVASPSEKTNAIEAEIIARIVHQIYLLHQDSFERDRTVGVIVPYRNQISTIRNAIDGFGIPALHDITIDTVERYQGSQRDYIIYGFTVMQPYQLNFLTNNVFEEDGEIIDRKLNVAMTRARLNLVMVGNPQLLRMNITFARLLDFIEERGGLTYTGSEFDM